MSVKRLTYIIIAFLLIFSSYYLYSNALIIDDNHGQSQEVIQGEYTLHNYYNIVINLDELNMYVYNGDELIKTYPVSGGSQYTPSPLGNWVIITKDTWGEGFGGAWLGFNVPWGEYGIHGTDSPWFIGRSNSSKGCIRMFNKDVNELYKLIPHGTSVTIVQENRSFRTLRNGDVGSDVKEVQELLKYLGYYNGYPDGVFGLYMEKAVKSFQKENNLWVSGTVYKKAYDLILQESSRYKSITTF